MNQPEPERDESIARAQTVTRLLATGRPANELPPLVYDELRSLAAEREGQWFSVVPEIRIARVLLELDLFAEAETLLRRGYDDFLSQHGSAFADSQLTRQLLYDLYTERRRPDEARLHAPARDSEHHSANPNGDTAR